MTSMRCRRLSLPSLGLLLAAACRGAAGAELPPADDPLARMLERRGIVAEKGVRGRNARDPASDVVLVALSHLNTPYRFTGESRDGGFDCSGFARYVYGQALGVSLPRRSSDQARSAQLRTVRSDDLRPGDLVFFNTKGPAYSHVGIYLGDQRFIHSPRTGGRVRIEDMRVRYWAQRFDGARRAQQLVATTG